MILEIVVWGSREWYAQAIPLLEDAGLTERPDLAWADPATDGEKMGCYYDIANGDAPIDAQSLTDVLSQIRRVVMAGETPDIEMRWVPERR